MIVALEFLRRIPAEVWALLAAVALLAGAIAWAYDEGKESGDSLRKKLQDRNNELQEKVQDLHSANAAAQNVISKLQDANRELAEGRVADQQAAAQAVADLRSERDELRKELDRRRNDRGVIYVQDPSAAAWARARVPDAVARSLRD